MNGFGYARRLRLNGWQGHLPSVAAADIVLTVGAAILAVPVLVQAAQEEWITDQGSQGPIMLMLGLWLLFREWPGACSAHRNPGVAWWATMLATLAAYVFARVTGQLWLSWVGVIAAVSLALAARIGPGGVRRLWAPIAFLVLLIPPPGLFSGPLIAALNPKVVEIAVGLFRNAGVEAANAGTMIYLGPYEMHMADACAGMGSLLSLFALGMLYLYLRHGGVWRYFLAIAPLVVVIALAANLARILLLMLVTLTLGDGVAQGWFHPVAGLILFALALAMLIAIDALLAPLRRVKAGNAAS